MASTLLNQIHEELTRFLKKEEERNSLHRDLRQRLEKVERAALKLNQLIEKFRLNSGFSKSDLAEIHITWEQVASYLPITQISLKYGPGAGAFYGDWHFNTLTELRGNIEKWDDKNNYYQTLANEHHDLVITLKPN